MAILRVPFKMAAGIRRESTRVTRQQVTDPQSAGSSRFVEYVSASCFCYETS